MKSKRCWGERELIRIRPYFEKIHSLGAETLAECLCGFVGDDAVLAVDLEEHLKQFLAKIYSGGEG